MWVLAGHIRRLVFIDECATHTEMCRSHGRSPRNRRCVFRTRTRTARHTLLAALCFDGVRAQRLLPRSGVDAASSEAFVA